MHLKNRKTYFASKLSSNVKCLTLGKTITKESSNKLIVFKQVLSVVSNLSKPTHYYLLMNSRVSPVSTPHRSWILNLDKFRSSFPREKRNL